MGAQSDCPKTGVMKTDPESGAAAEQPLSGGRIRGSWKAGAGRRRTPLFVKNDKEPEGRFGKL